MIRRDLPPQDYDRVSWPLQNPSGADRLLPGWILIAQTEHARLANALLQAWQTWSVMGADSHEGLDQLRTELTWAMTHHDDGWQSWDAAPPLDADGRPRAFREMDAEDSTAIWSRSIELAEKRSPLAAWLVARHFLDLAGDDPADLAFCARHADDCEQQLQRWLSGDAGRHVGVEPTRAASLALGSFDWLSLLLCCGTIAEPRAIEIGARQTRLVPIVGAPFELLLDPWPFDGSTQAFATFGRWVPKAAYASVKKLKQSAVPVQLRWTLVSPRNN